MQSAPFISAQNKLISNRMRRIEYGAYALRRPIVGARYSYLNINDSIPPGSFIPGNVIDVIQAQMAA